MESVLGERSLRSHVFSQTERQDLIMFDAFLIRIHHGLFKDLRSVFEVFDHHWNRLVVKVGHFEILLGRGDL